MTPSTFHSPIVAVAPALCDSGIVSLGCNWEDDDGWHAVGPDGSHTVHADTFEELAPLLAAASSARH